MPLTHLFKNLSSRRQPLRPLHEATDAELLQRFVNGQEDGAFEELVRRHGPLVRGVCQRVLQHNQDTEDAFQATFLVLARKAATINKRQSLASWLYKVAYRIALRARANRARRLSEERRVEEKRTDAEAYLERRDLACLIDEEVQRLPEKYRAPVLLCYLQGRTNEEAARQLHCPTGTIKIRLMRARQLLKKRLARRGVGLSMALLLSALVQTSQAAVPPALHDAAVQAGVDTRAGVSLPYLDISANARALAESQFKRLALAKLKLAAALLIIVALFFSTDHLLQQAQSAPVSDAGSVPWQPLPLSPSHDKSPSLADRLA